MALWRDQQVARLYVAVHQPSLVRLKKCATGLRDDVEHLVARERFFFFKDARQRITWHELHNQVGGSGIFAVVIDIGDAFVVNHRGVTCLGAETLEEARVTHELLLQDLDRNIAQDHLVLCLPNLAHAANGNSTNQFVSAAIELAYFWIHFCNTARITFWAIGAASELPRPD